LTEIKEDLNAALRIENGPRYSERGRVPLFYIDGLTIPSSANEPDGDATAMTPVYFRIKDLVSEYQKQYPNTTYEEIAPKIKTTDDIFERAYYAFKLSQKQLLFDRSSIE